MSEKIEVPKEQLEKLIEQNSEYEKEIKLMYEAVIGILDVLGLAENGKIKPEAFGENSNPLPELLKGGSKIMGLMFQSQVPVIGKKSEEELKQKFAFFGPLMPVIKKYSQLK